MDIWDKDEIDYAVAGHLDGDSDGMGAARGCVMACVLTIVAILAFLIWRLV